MSVSSPDGPLLEIRSRYYQFVGGGTALGAGVYGVVAGLTDRDLGVVYAIVWGVLCAVPFYRCVRAVLVDDGDVVTLRNVCSTRRIPRTAIERVRVVTIMGRGYTAAVAFDVRGQRRRRVASATLCYRKPTAQWMCCTLEREPPTTVSRQGLTRSSSGAISSSETPQRQRRSTVRRFQRARPRSAHAASRSASFGALDIGPYAAEPTWLSVASMTGALTARRSTYRARSRGQDQVISVPSGR